MSTKDSRTFIKLHDGMPEHPKVDGLSDKAFRALIEAWCWCSRNLSDGHVPIKTWRKRVAPKVSQELIDAGLIEPAEDGMQMHDYLKHQTSKAQVEHIKKVRSEAGSKGGRPRSTAKQTETNLLSKPASKQNPEDRRQKSEEQEKTTSSSSARATRIPNDFTVTPDMVAWARQHTPLVGQVETDKFIDYWQAKSGKDATKRDWVATWRNWMRRAQDEAERRGAPRPTRATKDDRISALDAFLVPENSQPTLRALTGGVA